MREDVFPSNERLKAMSVAPRKRQLATKVRRVVKGQSRHFSPQRTKPSFDDLVGELLELHRHVEAQRLGGLEIDD